ncbi:hypothetical protein D9758_014833 [Tetrapyrgos nigripes]|uniref:Glucose-methanol-choline oxidoreductase N-terminal domain-containing protein n=1 Tax=Tetrapyrgos nigripes TaxID=182062 RepID=A0A8H5FF43_9AGAR|nr:hypothetical protein D9758_014833 [Tetrapyrgos nigripes]
MTTSTSLRRFVALLVIAAVAPCLALIHDDSSTLHKAQYDFVVVGGGTAGLVVANRLSESPEVSVLVIEGGVSNTKDALNIQVPFFCTKATPDTPFDWNYSTTPQEALLNRSIPYRRGHVLGGSSSTNFLAYNRGPSDDWDRIAAFTGDDGWSWEKLQPYILRNEILTRSMDGHDISPQIIPSVHGHSGMNGDSLASYPTPLDNRVIRTTEELKHDFPFNHDMNSGFHLGIGWQVSTIRNGSRSSAATSYMASQYANRKNLDVVLNTKVTRVIPEANSTTFKTVEYVSTSGQKNQVTAKKEIILSAGSIGTVQVLTLSGIADPENLSQLGIESVLNNPSVGQNLSDHPIVGQSWFVNDTHTWEAAARNATIAAEQLREWKTSRTGPLTDALGNHQGWLRIQKNSSIFEQYSDPSAGPDAAHYEIIFANGLNFATPPPTGNFMTISTVVVSPLARGSVHLNASDPLGNPIINPNLLGHDFDMFVMRKAVLSARHFLTAPVWSDYVLSPLVNATTDEEINAFIRNNTRTIFHPVGTAAMTSEHSGYGVVNPDLKIPAEIAKIAGPLVIGYILNSVLYGILLLQVYMYYMAFPKDRLVLKMLVYGCFILDTAQTVMNIADAFSIFGSGFGDMGNLRKMHLAGLSVPIITGLISCAVQNFYAYQLYILSNSRVLSLIISSVALVQCTGAVVQGVFAFKIDNLATLQSRTFIECTIWLAGSALCDIIIAVSMTLFLVKSDTGLRRTHAIIRKLIRLTIETGSATATVAFIDCVLFLTVQSYPYHTVPARCLGKLYSNTLMAILNSRMRIPGSREDPELHSTSIASPRDYHCYDDPWGTIDLNFTTMRSRRESSNRGTFSLSRTGQGRSDINTMSMSMSAGSIDVTDGIHVTKETWSRSIPVSVLTSKKGTRHSVAIRESMVNQ